MSATACTAVGSYGGTGGTGKTLVESWNGTSWSVVPSPSPGSTSNFLSGVSCVSATACRAVGGSRTGGGLGVTLVESWDGASWSKVPNTPSGLLNAVSCATASACTAAGQRRGSTGFAKTLIESGTASG